METLSHLRPVQDTAESRTQIEEANVDVRSTLRAVEPCRVAAARSFSQIEELRPYWSRWQNDPLSDIDLYLDRIEHSNGSSHPHVMVLFRGKTPIALYIAAVEEQRLRFKFGFWKLKMPKTRVLSFAYGDILGDQSQENIDLLLKEILACLGRRQADLAILHNVNTDSPLYRRALGIPRWFARDHTPASHAHYAMELPEDSKLIYQRLSADHRKELRRSRKKVEAKYGEANVRLLRYRGESDVQQLTEKAEAVARKTYQRALGVGFCPTPLMAGRLRIAGQRDWLRGYVLAIQDGPCAFAIGTLYQGTFYLDYVGYDPAFAQYSVGSLLLTDVMDSLCVEGAKAFDFGFGEELYKVRFGTQKTDEARVHLFGPSLRGLLVNLAKSGAVLLSLAIARFFQETKLFARVRTMWRNRLKKRQLSAANAESEKAS